MFFDNPSSTMPAVTCVDPLADWRHVPGRPRPPRRAAGAPRAPEPRPQLRGNLSHRAPSRRRTTPPCALTDVEPVLERLRLEGHPALGVLGIPAAICSPSTCPGTGLAGGGFPFPPSLWTPDTSRNKLSDAGLLDYSLTA
jgi:hypothetical protein